MDKLEIGNLVVLSAGSMRMAVEAVDGDQISCLWCHEGKIGRDVFSSVLLKKWEQREDTGGSRPFRGDRDGGGRPQRAGGGDRDRGGDRGGDDRPPRGKPGWDGKPREKKFFRKD